MPNISSQDVKTSMDLVSHVANKHNEEEVEYNLKILSAHKFNKEGKTLRFVFSESMLNNFFFKW